MNNSFQNVPDRVLSAVEDVLSNDDVSSDEELFEFFEGEGLTAAQARYALSYRDRYTVEIYKAGHTPLRVGNQALIFDPHTWQFRAAAH